MAIDTADTALMLICMALVQFMTPGLAFFYGGLVGERSVLTMMMQSFVSMGLISIFWFVFVFSLCFGESGIFVGNPLTYFFFRNVNVSSQLDGSDGGIPGLLFAMYQGMFAVITPALMSGAFADRFRFMPYLFFIVLWLILVYAPVCHWVWGGGWLAKWGVWDFAGGIVVHVTAGFSAVAAVIVVGKRVPDPNISPEDADKPHNVPFVALGTAILWFGWFGFNGGSALASNGSAVAAAANSQIAGSVALFFWLVIDWCCHGRPGLVGLCVGAVAGLATITPASGFIQPWGAFILGVAASTLCYCCCELRKILDLDDALDVWGVHGMGGFIGSVLLGVLADGEECGKADSASAHCINPGTVTRSIEQFGKQLAAAVLVAIYSFLVTFVMLHAINRVMPIRPKERKVLAGLDFHEHGEDAYHTASQDTLRTLYRSSDESTEYSSTLKDTPRSFREDTPLVDAP